MFRRRVWRSIEARRQCGNRRIVNNTSSHWLLRFHNFNRLFRTQKCRVNIGVKYAYPLSKLNLFNTFCRTIIARIIEQEIQSTKTSLNLGK